MLSTTDLIISVHVGGPTATVFHLHSERLSKSSEFFQAKLKSEWLRGERRVLLAQESPVVFGVYSSWMYSGALYTLPSNDEDATDGFHQNEFRQLAQCYVLGESLLDTKFQNAVIDAIYSKLRDGSGTTFHEIGAEVVTIIYKGTVAESPARLLMVDIFTSHANKDQMREVVEDVPAEFLQDLAIAFARQKTRSVSKIEYKPSSYHR